MGIIFLSFFALPFLSKKPIEIPPLISVELIQISDITNIPYAPKAKKIIEKAKKENEKKLVSEQAPPKKIKKDKNKKVKLDKVKEDENKVLNLDVEKESISQAKSKKSPTPENKKELVEKEKLEAIPMPDTKKEKIDFEEEKKQQP